MRGRTPRSFLVLHVIEPNHYLVLLIHRAVERDHSLLVHLFELSRPKEVSTLIDSQYENSIALRVWAVDGHECQSLTSCTIVRVLVCGIRLGQ